MSCVDCASKRKESTMCDCGCPHYNCLDCRDRRLARSDIVSFCLLVNKSKKPSSLLESMKPDIRMDHVLKHKPTIIYFLTRYRAD